MGFLISTIFTWFISTTCVIQPGVAVNLGTNLGSGISILIIKILADCHVSEEIRLYDKCLASVTSLYLESPEYQSQICSFDQFHKDVYRMELTKENYQKEIKKPVTTILIVYSCAAKGGGVLLSLIQNNFKRHR